MAIKRRVKDPVKAKPVEKKKKGKGGANKRKGSNYERDICKQLSKWYSENENDDIFWRTAGSGARATQRMKRSCLTTNSAGDVCALDKSGYPLTSNYLIEIKRGYGNKVITRRSKKTGKETNSVQTGISLMDIVDKFVYQKQRKSKPPILIQWLEKAYAEAKQNKIKEVILIFKRDKKQSCIVLSKKTFELLRENNGRWVYPHCGPLVTVWYDKWEFVVARLEDFFAWCRPQAFFKKLKKVRRRRSWEKGKYAGKKIKNSK